MQPHQPSFVIVVSEKGGAERRVSFTTGVVNIGRVQGNELTLNKTNVSKQHASLVYQDGAFVVSDLASTNGTYINRRRIHEPTKLNEGDRLYIGDFVLRLELVEHPSQSTSLPDSEVPVEVVELSSPNLIADSTTSKRKAPVDATATRELATRQVSYPEVPSPPRVPTPAASMGAWAENSPARISLSSDDIQASVRASLSEPAAPGASVTTLLPGDRESAGLLAALVENVVEQLGERWNAGTVDSTQQTSVDRILDEQLQRLIHSASSTVAVQPDKLRALARAEILGLGCIGRLLEDPLITEILVPRHDQVLGRRGTVLESTEFGISSRRSLRRIILRLCLKAGSPAGAEEGTIVRVLPNGGVLWAVLPPQAFGQPSFIYRKPRESTTSLQSLVRVGVVSRAMSLFLQQAVLGHGRLLVVGPRDAELSAVTGALLGCVSDGPLALLEGATDLGVSAPQVPCFRWSLIGAKEPRTLVRAAARAASCQLGVVLEDAELTAAVVDVLGGSSVGVVAMREARSAGVALNQMAAEILTVHRGLPAEHARQMIAGAFDLVLEVVRYRDGRQRLIRVAELGQATQVAIELEDIFTFVAQAGPASDVVEGTFRSTGTVPRLVEQLSLRGAPFDLNAFGRQTPR